MIISISKEISIIISISQEISTIISISQEISEVQDWNGWHISAVSDKQLYQKSNPNTIMIINVNASPLVHIVLMIPKFTINIMHVTLVTNQQQQSILIIITDH